MHVYLKNNRAKFHVNTILNDGALGFYWRASPKEMNNKMSSYTRSVSDQKYHADYCAAYI